ncbi:MAG: HK97 family phage prohead protease, partial [Selenomonadaceae bacterium]|nr:HK97 family phage prohead protease [Selenomonadaceae bacterium]
MNQKENRSYTFRDLRMVDDNGGEKIIEGHAAVFETVTNISGTFYEVIERGAFEGCDLSEVVLLLNHDHRSLPLAKTQSGT